MSPTMAHVDVIYTNWISASVDQSSAQFSCGPLRTLNTAFATVPSVNNAWTLTILSEQLLITGSNHDIINNNNEHLKRPTRLNIVMI